MRKSFYIAVFAFLAGLYAPPAMAQLLTGYVQPVPQEESAFDFNENDGVTEPISLFIDVPSVKTQKSPQFEALQPAPQLNVFHPVMTAKAPLASPQNSGEAPVDLQADQMRHDDQANTVTASGDVMIVQAGRILRADEVSYNVNADTVNAQGLVVLNEESGDIHLADTAQYNNKLRDGHVENLRTVLSDGSRFTASEGDYKNGITTTMQDATYTPCEPCKTDPERPPLWGIRASEVTHDKEERRVSYKNARFEALGVPVLYTPYFAHADGTIKQKSGFLSPSFGYRSELGAFAQNDYYWAIDTDRDVTFGIMAMTEQPPLGTAEYRQRWSDAALEVSGGVTTSERTDRSGGRSFTEEGELRGHVLAEGRWDMNHKWRSGVDVNWTSDEQYMRQYDFVNEDVLENRVFAERFSGRNYAVAQMIAFQDIRIRENPQDQPDVLPEIIASFKGEPAAIPLIKGQWSVDASALGLRRDGSEQDMQRFSLAAGWDRRLVSDYGLLTIAEAKIRGDSYHVTDRFGVSAAQSSSSTAGRFYPQFHMRSSYPMAKEFETMQAKIEPVIALTAAPKIKVDSDIPNEDSNDVQIDASNILEPNRFSGLDRVEDQSRVTYGFRTGLFGYEGSYGDVFLGQSYRFSEDDNPFPQGSGLDNQKSDIVGQVSGQYNDIYSLNYRFQLDNNGLTSQRQEVDASANWNRFALQTRYLFASALEGTDISESREQLRLDGQLYLTKNWRWRAGATQDLGESPGLRQAYTGLDYLGQCLFWSLTGQRNLTEDASGDSNLEVLFRIGLKNLGDFPTSSFRPTVENE